MAPGVISAAFMIFSYDAIYLNILLSTRVYA